MSLGRPTVSNPVGDIKALFEKYDIGCLTMWEPADLAENIICSPSPESPEACRGEASLVGKP